MPLETTPVNSRVVSALKSSLGTVLPLAVVLVLTIWLVVRERIRETDITVLGIVFTITGMFLFTLGMEQGISELGAQAGTALPHAYAETTQEVTIVRADDSAVFTAATPRGPRQYIWVQQNKSLPQAVPFEPLNYDPRTGIYRYIPVAQAVFAEWGPTVGIIVVLIFVYILGFGATLAEPSLAALGATVEDLTTGTYKKSTLIFMVALGVGAGMSVGFARILFDLPLAWILVISYIPALLLTVISAEDFAAIAWDSAGVTTGPVTVPLVIAAGLSIGRESGITGGAFGIVAAASVFPILAVLISGILNQNNARKSITSEVVL
jgi:hypothetical protein